MGMWRTVRNRGSGVPGDRGGRRHQGERDLEALHRYRHRGSDDVALSRQKTYVLTYRLATGNHAETLQLLEGQGRWPDPRVDTSPWTYLTPRLVGPGVLKASPLIFTVGPAGCVRGLGGTPELASVALPAHAATTLVQPVMIGAPPLPGTQWTPKIVVGLAQSEAGMRPRVPHIRVTGRTGVDIRLRTRPPLPLEDTAEYRLTLGRSLTVYGTTDPRLADVRLKLEDLDTVSRSRPSVGVVKTDARGRFRATVRPARSGLNFITVFYVHPRHGLVADQSCGLAVAVHRRR